MQGITKLLAVDGTKCLERKDFFEKAHVGNQTTMRIAKKKCIKGEKETGISLPVFRSLCKDAKI